MRVRENPCLAYFTQWYAHCLDEFWHSDFLLNINCFLDCSTSKRVKTGFQLVWICTAIIGKFLTFIKNVEDFNMRKMLTYMLLICELTTRFSIYLLSLHLSSFCLFTCWTCPQLKLLSSHSISYTICRHFLNWLIARC